MKPARIFATLAALLVVTPSLAQTPALPADAVQLKGAEIGAYLDGKQFATTIYDADALIVATVNWNLKKGLVFGTYEVNGTKGEFSNEWTQKGDTSCGERSAKGTLICQKVYVAGDTMYEVNKKGKIHAVSQLR